MNKPEPMTNPCICCPRSTVCDSALNYTCPRFRQAFVQSWDSTVAFLRKLVQQCR